MAASGAKSGFGTALTIGAAVTEVISVTGPGMSRTAIDVTHMASDDGWREFIGGLPDGGEITFEVSFIKSVASTLLGYFSNAALQASTIVYPNSLGTITFSSILTGYSPTAELDSQVQASVTVKVSGKPVLS